MEGFMRKIYNFINGLEVLHLVGTYEKTDQEEEEIYVRDFSIYTCCQGVDTDL